METNPFTKHVFLVRREVIASLNRVHERVKGLR